jgi:hypothetical protein
VLSVTCLSGDVRRLAAVLRLLRPVADEIVVAIDDRADPRLVGSATELADRAFLVPYADPVERTLQWLHEQTTGDWVFRIDDDEAPSRTLLAALADPPADVTHCFVPRRCLWRDGWLEAYPWQPDWQLRLGRRDALAFPGIIHVPVRATGPARYLDAPLYHVDLLKADRATREAKVRRYAAMGPGLRVAGREQNEAYFVPESRSPPVSPVPPDDLELALGVLNAPELAAGAPAGLEAATRAQIDARWAERELPEEAYRARLEVAGTFPVAAGEVRLIDVQVTNLGTETWAWGPHGLPEIRLSYVGLDDAPRTPLPHDLPPGATASVPVAVRAPDEPGTYPITIDLVHERHRWFGCGSGIALDVQPRRRAVVLVGQPPGEDAFDRRVDEVLVGLDPALEPLLVGAKPAWLKDRFGLPAQAAPPPWRPDAVVVVPAGPRRNRLRLELTAARLRRSRH